MKDLAIAKLKKELSELKTANRYINAIAKPVHDALVEFCTQNNEFAQAVVQGESFLKCMESVVKGISNSISDLDAYRRAVQFYFPGADIRFKMEINLCASVQVDEPAPERDALSLDLFALL